MHELKFADGSDELIEGVLAPHGGIFNGRDIAGEYFSGKTDFVLDLFESRPLMFHHGMDPDVDVKAVGRITELKHTDKGLWMQAWLDRRSAYYDAIKQMIGDEALELSSGAISHLVKVAKSGEILRWPVMEGSLTPTPACPGLARVDFAKAVNHFKSADITLDPDALKAAMDAAARDALEDDDFAYIDANGGRHLPINDAAHVRSALSRFNQTTFESDSAKETARDRILARAKKLGITVSEDSAVGGGKSWDDLESVPADQWAAIKLCQDGTYVATKAMEGSYEDLLCDLEALLNPVSPYGDCSYSCVLGTFPGYVIVRRYEQDPDSDFEDQDETYWRVQYSVSDTGDPILGTATQMDQTFVPRKSISSDGPLTIDALSLSRHAEALTQRTEGLHERRVKEGRVLSSVNRQRLNDAVKTLDSARAALTDLLAASDQMLSDQAKAAALRSPDSLRDRLALLQLFEQTL